MQGSQMSSRVGTGEGCSQKVIDVLVHKGWMLKHYSDAYLWRMSTVRQILGVLSSVAKFGVHLAETRYLELRRPVCDGKVENGIIRRNRGGLKLEDGGDWISGHSVFQRKHHARMKVGTNDGQNCVTKTYLEKSVQTTLYWNEPERQNCGLSNCAVDGSQLKKRCQGKVGEVVRRVLQAKEGLPVPKVIINTASNKEYNKEQSTTMRFVKRRLAWRTSSWSFRTWQNEEV